MHMIDGTTCLMEVEQLIREYTQMLGRDLSFQKLEEELRDLLRKYSGTEAVHGACRPDPGAVGGRRILKTIYGISHGEEACLYAK